MCCRRVGVVQDRQWAYIAWRWHLYFCKSMGPKGTLNTLNCHTIILRDKQRTNDIDGFCIRLLTAAAQAVVTRALTRTCCTCVPPTRLALQKHSHKHTHLMVLGLLYSYSVNLTACVITLPCAQLQRAPHGATAMVGMSIKVCRRT